MIKLNIESDMIVMALDGDGIGRLCGRAVMANDPDKLHNVSARIDAAQDFIQHWAKRHGGVKISGGGDEATLAIKRDDKDKIESLRKDIEHAFGYTVSVGIGKDLSEAFTALMVAKLRGKNRIVTFNYELKKDIKKAKRRVRERRANETEIKLAEAYLGKAEGEPMQPEQECAYCDQTDGLDASHCKYCHENEAAEVDCPYCAESECPYCKESEDGSDCAYCKQNEQASEQEPQANPDSTNAAPAGSEEEKAQANAMGMNPPVQGKPELGNNSSPSGVGEAGLGSSGASPEQPGLPGEGVQNEKEIGKEGAHSEEDLKAIAAAMESQTPEGHPEEKEIADSIPDENIVGSNMEGNTSRPENFDSSKPGDMGLGNSGEPEESQDNTPDMSSILQEGLDSGADDMQREKVVQMCSQALMGFKGCRDILEQSKMQTPQLYQSSLMMLKAMIEMAKLLGLEEPGQPIQGEEVIQELGSQGQENEWHDPFPSHPDQGGERKPGHGPGKDGDKGAIGQPIGKLPQRTTTHVAQEPIPEGGVNAKGQLKITDDNGIVRFISMREGRVKGPAGVPIKSPSRG
jgi:hypothetical protein